MKYSDVARWNDPLARTAAIIGERWTLLILRQFFLGLHHFDDIQQTLELATNVLSERLNRLLEEGVLEREGRRYSLTKKGHALYSVIGAMLEWGDEYTIGEEGPPVIRKHRKCGHETKAKLVCSHCGEEITAHDVWVEDGPSAQLGSPFTEAQERIALRAAKAKRR